MRITQIVCLCVIVASFVGVSAFQCSSTIDTYNSFVNVGNFKSAADATFSDNVVQPQCPYCSTYYGKAAVTQLFEQGFLGHFIIFNPLVNLRQLTSNNGGPQGVPRLLDFNDEAFRIFPQFNNRYFRVAVIHDFLFDPVTCLITQMQLFHDPYVASMAFAGYQAVTVPIMPGVSANPPISAFNLSMQASLPNLLNYQYIPGEELVSARDAWAVINAYYTKLQSGFVSGISSMFVDVDYSLPTANGAILVPGDQAVLPYSGLYLSQIQIEQYHSLFAQSVRESTPLTDPTATNVTMSGSVAVFWRASGTSLGNSNVYTMTACDYFQIVQSGGVNKIARLTRFFDTWNATIAVTNNNPFMQFQNEISTSIGIMFPLVKVIIALCCANFAVMFLAIYCMRKSSDTPTVRTRPGGERGTPLLPTQ